MKLEDIVIVPKITKFEWDMRRLHLKEEQVIEFYREKGLDVGKIIESHRGQKESLERIRSILKGSQIIERDDLTKEAVRNKGLVIAFGGDNHFQYVSHFLDEAPILGINSDPMRSEGALTSIGIRDVGKDLLLSLDDKMKMEEWSRLESYVNGKKVDALAISEVFIGEENRFNMSRHILKVNGKSEEQKGSGLIVATGAGSTGWYNSASRYLFSGRSAFPKTEKEARFILTEPYEGTLSSCNLSNGYIRDDQEMEITSLSDTQAYLSIDSLDLIRLREGARIKIRLGKPLRVLNLPKEE